MKKDEAKCLWCGKGVVPPKLSFCSGAVKIITVMVAEGSKQSLIADHKKFLTELSDEVNPWHHPGYTSIDQYFDYLLGGETREGLLKEMSDDIVYVNKSSELEKAFDSIIGEQAISCE